MPTHRNETSLFRTAVSAALVACSRADPIRLGDKFAHPRFDDGAISRIHGLDLNPSQIDANDIVPPVGATGGNYGANISKPNTLNGAIHALGRISSKLTLGLQIKDRLPKPRCRSLRMSYCIRHNLFSTTSKVTMVRSEKPENSSSTAYNGRLADSISTILSRTMRP